MSLTYHIHTSFFRHKVHSPQGSVHSTIQVYDIGFFQVLCSGK